jgi:hypothetical protein
LDMVRNSRSGTYHLFKNPLFRIILGWILINILHTIYVYRV